MAGVGAETIGDVEHRVGDPSELAPFGGADRRAQEPAVAERGAGAAERPGHDEEVARLRARTARHALGMAESGDGDDDEVGLRRVAAANRHAGLRDPLVERDRALEIRRRERHDERERLGARGGEVADVHRRGAKAELAPVEEVEAEVDSLDERVLRHDEAFDLSRVVLDADDQAAPLELGEELELLHGTFRSVEPTLMTPSTSRARRPCRDRERRARRTAARGTCPARLRRLRRPRRRPRTR